MKTIAVLTCVTLLLIAGTHIWGSSKTVKSEIYNFEIVYCPTMEEYIQSMDLSRDVRMKRVESSGQALQYLSQTSENTMAIIGRKARPDELPGEIELMQNDDEAITTISDQLAEIWLTEDNFKTFYVRSKDSDKLENIDKAELVFVERDDESIIETGEIWMVKWSEIDYTIHNLVIVRDKNGNKLFRSPHIYAKSNVFDRFSKIINANKKNI
jgi:hypothetical protein